MPLPPGSPASHVSALCLRAGELDAGLYGDGVYRSRRGLGAASRVRRSQTREVTALAAVPGGLAVGTRPGRGLGLGRRRLAFARSARRAAVGGHLRDGRLSRRALGLHL